MVVDAVCTHADTRAFALPARELQQMRQQLQKSSATPERRDCKRYDACVAPGISLPVAMPDSDTVTPVCILIASKIRFVFTAYCRLNVCSLQ